MLNAKRRALTSSLIIALIMLIAPIVSLAENILPISSPSSPGLHRWGVVTLFHGLPSNTARAIAQDQDGALWFGTDSGLVRYDGRRVQKIAAEGLAAGRILALKFDSTGALWIGTDAGAARLTDGNLNSIPETAGKTVTAIITPEMGRAIMTSSQGMIFDCSTEADGALRVQIIGPDKHPLLSMDTEGRAPLPLTSLALVDETLIVSTLGRGLLSIERDEVKEVLSRPRPFFIEAMETDSKDVLWFGAQMKGEAGGLYESEGLLRPTKLNTDTGTVTALCFDSKGGLWVGTDDRGAFHWQSENGAISRRVEHFDFENTAGSMRSNRIYSIFVDREGVVWFGTDRGICRYDPRSLLIEIVSSRPDSNFARVLFQSSDGVLWCGTNSGLFARDSREPVWLPVKELATKTVHSIFEDSMGRLLVGTAAGLYAGVKLPRNRSPVGNHRFTHIAVESGVTGSGDSIRSICEFQGSVYIASFGRGVERLDGLRREVLWPVESANERERQIVSLHSDRDERLWISTAEAGVYVFDGAQVRAVPSLESLRDNAVWVIEGTEDDALWLGTTRGLYAFRSGELRPLIEGADVRAIAVSASGDQKSLWCATVGGGLFRLLVDEQGEAIISQMNAEQGLPSESAFAVLPARSAAGDEILWIATNRGVARYEPNSVAPLLRATRVMGKRVYNTNEISAGLNLEYPQNSLSLDVAAISSRTFPDQFQYSFSLFDDAGKLVRKRLARDSQFLMESLRPGRYRVEARAYMNDLMPSDPMAFEFTIASAPFPWTSTALSVLLALALAALWWGWHQNRRLAGTNEALGEANRQIGETRLQLANETETERRRIARDLHDQTLADLRRLLLLADDLHAGEMNNNQRTVAPPEFRREIESITTEIRRICEDLSPSALANVGLAAALEWALSDAVAHMPAERKFEYEFLCDDNLEERMNLASGMQIQIYRIAQEAISNVCRHAGASHARLSVVIESSGDFTLVLEDDGRGFDPSSKSVMTGRGLANIRSRASLIEAEVDWSNLSGGGTTFTLRKPRSNKATV